MVPAFRRTFDQISERNHIELNTIIIIIIGFVLSIFAHDFEIMLGEVHVAFGGHRVQQTIENLEIIYMSEINIFKNDKKLWQ